MTATSDLTAPDGWTLDVRYPLGEATRYYLLPPLLPGTVAERAYEIYQDGPRTFIDLLDMQSLTSDGDRKRATVSYDDSLVADYSPGADERFALVPDDEAETVMAMALVVRARLT